jgi:hypothetical protein
MKASPFHKIPRFCVCLPSRDPEDPSRDFRLAGLKDIGRPFYNHLSNIMQTQSFVGLGDQP